MSGMMSRRRKAILTSVVVVGVAFFFLAPIVPTEVEPVCMLPWANEPLPRIPASALLLLMTPVPAYGSISYMLFGHKAPNRVAYRGEYGLVYIPAFMNRTYFGGYDFQFPPLGFNARIC